MSAAVHAHPATGPVLGVAGKPRKVLSDAGMRGRWWRFDYRHQGRRKTLILGTYPEVTLAAARRSPRGW